MKNPRPRAKRATLLFLTFLALAPVALAVDPPPDGGYPNENTGEGQDALFSLTTGPDNTAIGFNALYSNTTGGSNTATGSSALTSNTTGYYNTATGTGALKFNTTGGSNTANGVSALWMNTSGGGNTASGSFALWFNTTGSSNTADGTDTLSTNTTGSLNTAIGFSALYSNTAGDYNTANGTWAQFQNTTGSYNTAIGVSALLHNRSGSNNIALGYNAGHNITTGHENIDIGNSGVTGDSGAIRIGRTGSHNNTFIAGISGATVAGGVAVIIDSTGHLGTIVSSERFKDGIKPMDKASEAILSLQPVTFHYRKDLDPNAIMQFGLVAEQVEKVNPDLVARDEQGKPYTVRYEAVNAMLLNEFLKEHRKVETLEATVAAQQKSFESKIEALTEALKAQAAQIQKVSDQIKTQASMPRVVAEK